MTLRGKKAVERRLEAKNSVGFILDESCYILQFLISGTYQSSDRMKKTQNFCVQLTPTRGTPSTVD